MEKNELNYFDDLVNAAERGRVEGGSPGESVAIRAAMEAAWNGATLASLLDLLETKKVITRPEREELIANVKKTLEQMTKATAERYPEFAKGAEEYDKQHP